MRPCAASPAPRGRWASRSKASARASKGKTAMGQHGKKFKNASAKVDRLKRYPIDEACKLVPETKVAKFDESVDIAVRLGVDPKHAAPSEGGAAGRPPR